MATFAEMKATIFTAMPMFVCMFWSIILLLDLIEERMRQDTISHTQTFNSPRILLFIFMVTATLLYIGHCVYFNQNTTIIPVTDTVYCLANLAVYPLYYLYICALTLRSNHYRERWVILVPAIGAGIVVGTLYAMMDANECQKFIEIYLYKGKRHGLYGLAATQAYAHDVCKALFAILVIPVFVQGRSHIKAYNHLVENTYADTENKTLFHLHYMLTIFVITAIASFVSNIIGRHQFLDSIWMLAIPSILFSTMLFIIGYLGYRQRFSIADIEMEEQQNDSLDEEAPIISELRKQIELLMEKEQLYRQSNLKIEDIVKRLNTNRNYVYKAINQGMGQSFSEYVNRMRIEHAAELITTQPDIQLSEVADKTGFSSTTSFYRNFKLYKGIAPKEFLLKAKKENKKSKIG